MTKEEIQAEADKRYSPLRNNITTEEEVRDALNDGFVEGATWMQSKADDLVKEAIEMGKPKWISVKDKLPEGNVLVIDSYGEINVAFYDDSIEGFWLSCDGTSEIIADVTHWMPLPEPPKHE